MLVLLTRSVLILSLSHQCAGFAIPKLTICRNFSPASNALHTPPTNLTDPIVKMFGKVFWYRKLELQSWIPTPSRKPGYYKAQKTIHRCSRTQTRWEEPRKTNSYNLHQLFNPYSDLPYIHRTRCLNFRSLISLLSLLLMFLGCQKTFFLYVFSGLGTDIGVQKVLIQYKQREKGNTNKRKKGRSLMTKTKKSWRKKLFGSCGFLR